LADPNAVRSALDGGGLWLDVGLALIRVRSDAPALAAQLQATYRHFPFVTDGPWADLHVDVQRQTGARRWWRPQVVFRCDARSPFDPFPADSPLPLLEWGANWLIGRRMNDHLLLHAGVVERQGLALIMPATPGSGKSTLSAALSLRGWRLLSDEFGALDTRTDRLRAVLKPIALKNQSIAVIRHWTDDAALGPVFPQTRKGAVAHLAADADAVARRHQTVAVGAIVLPRWEAGSPTRWQRLAPDEGFRALAFNAFNYAVLGADAFQAVVRIVRRHPVWQLTYSELEDATALLAREWPAVVESVATAEAP
jgi:HprK-related kinase A